VSETILVVRLTKFETEIHRE